MKNKPDIDKINLYAKDSYETKYQFLVNKRETTGLKHFNDLKDFIDYSNDMEDVVEIKILMNTTQIKKVKQQQFLMM